MRVTGLVSNKETYSILNFKLFWGFSPGQAYSNFVSEIKIEEKKYDHFAKKS